MKKFLAVAIVGLASLAQGATITSPADPLLTGATVITFDEVTLGTTNPTISGVSFVGEGLATEVVTTPGNPSTPDLSNHGVDVHVDFADLVTAFGMDILLADQDVTIEAYDSAGALLATAVLLSPPGTIVDGFLGIGDVGLISSVEVDTSEFIRIDNFHFVPAAPIPEPGTMLLLGSGLLGLAGYSRQRKH